MIIDTHSHYDDEKFDEDREELLTHLHDNGIEAVVNIGANLETSRKTIELTKKYEFVYGAIGVHPSDTDELNEERFAWLATEAEQMKIVAIGEIGLDYYWDAADREVQKYWFRKQLRLACDCSLPVVIHSRDAAQDTLSILQEEVLSARERGKEMEGVIHCFAYGPEMAEQFLRLNFYLGIGGVVTFKNAKKLKEVVKNMPMNRLVLETDCPYLAPEPYRGKRNESRYLPHVVTEIAKLRGMTEDEVQDVTSKNAKSLYHIL